MEDKKYHKAFTDTDRLIIQKYNQEHPLGHQRGLVNWGIAQIMPLFSILFFILCSLLQLAIPLIKAKSLRFLA